MGEAKVNDQAIFEVARGIASHEARHQYLQQACREDAAQAQRINALLRALKRMPASWNHLQLTLALP